MPSGVMKLGAQSAAGVAGGSSVNETCDSERCRGGVCLSGGLSRKVGTACGTGCACGWSARPENGREDQLTRKHGPAGL